MTNMQKIETSIGEDELAPGCPQAFGAFGQLLCVYDLCGHLLPDNKLQCARNNLKHGRFIANQFAVDIEPHARAANGWKFLDAPENNGVTA